MEEERDYTSRCVICGEEATCGVKRGDDLLWFCNEHRQEVFDIADKIKVLRP